MVDHYSWFTILIVCERVALKWIVVNYSDYYVWGAWVEIPIQVKYNELSNDLFSPVCSFIKKHRQKTVYDAPVCVQQLRLDHKIAVCRPSPSCLPFMALILSSFSLHLVGPYNFFWPCSCHCVQTLLHTFLSNAFNKSMPRALQVLCKSIWNIFTLLLGFINTGSIDCNKKHSTFNGYLDCLSMVPENIHSYNCFVEFWIVWLHQLIVKMFLSIITNT